MVVETERARAGGCAMTMANESLAAVLEREHRGIDEGIERFAAEPSSFEAARSLAAAIALLRRHIYLEEEFVFPALSGGGLVAPIFVMLASMSRSGSGWMRSSVRSIPA